MARPATRRSSDEVKQRLIEAARDLYEAGTYDETTTKGIAAHAGVAESVLFRHFATKDNLLAVAIVAPFEEFLADFSATWQAFASRGRGGDAEALVGEFVRDLYGRLTEYRPLLRRLLVASISDPAVAAAVRQRLDAVITGIIEIAEESAERRGVAVSRATTNVRIVVALVSALTVLDDWFAPEPADPERVIREVTTLVFRGLAGQASA
jgi:AcrR family transcriptional regulator